jgi:probable addiction module antidote protein
MTKENPLGFTPFDAAEYLKDEESIAEFLNASIEMNDPTVLLNAVSTVARARSMSELAAASGLGRESLYKALKPGSQPRYDTVMKVLSALGVEMVFRALPKAVSAAKPAPAHTDRKRKKAAPRTRSSEARALANVEGRKVSPKSKAARGSIRSA